jgi:NAD+ kinase
MKVAIIADPAKDLMGFGREVGNWLRDNYKASPNWGCDWNQIDIAILLGGDGFIMREGLAMANHRRPFIAINCGAKGFLAAAEINNWQEVLGKVFERRYAIEERPILDVDYFYGGELNSFQAAGNIYIRHRAYMILFSLTIDGKIVYKELDGDGVIVANATGATAYNLAAKGAIISSGLVVTPICPHRLDVVSLPVPESAKKIEIIYHGRKGGQQDDEGCLFFIDSQKRQIFPGARIEIRKSQEEISLIIPEGFSFIESLQKKMGLST